jgi:hypothetical protein
MLGSNRDERNKTLATFGYVSFAVAVGAFYFWMFHDMGASSARYRVKQEQASQAIEDTSKEVRAECAGRSDRATCEREIEQANREGQRNEKDLEAQRSMSDWAFWLLVISAFQFPATLAASLCQAHSRCDLGGCQRYRRSHQGDAGGERNCSRCSTTVDRHQI